jgi:hypothetical protein
MGILYQFSTRTASEWTRKIKEVAEAAREQGWTVNITKKNQYQFIPPDPTQQIVMAAGTASDHRALDNVIARLKRSGFLWPWDGKAKEQPNQQESTVAPEEKKPEFEQIDYAAQQEAEEAKSDIKFLDKMIKDQVPVDEINQYVEMMGPEKQAYRKAYKSNG